MALQNSTIDEMHDFLNKRYYIPNYQREYSWGNEELSDFWSDLIDTMEDKDDSHFFGQVVVHDCIEDKKKYIIDGQQRTTSSMIFLKALQEFYRILYSETNIPKADYRRTDIETIYLGRIDEFHLTLGESDNDYYVSHILKKIDVDKKPKKKSHDNIRKAYLFFQEKINDKLTHIPNAEDKIEYLDNIFNTFIHRFKVLYMEATKLEEAFVIFETLNARGRDLETADLLKNHILSQSKQKIDTSINTWNLMLNKLDKIDPTKYIRHFWNATQEFTREKQLYKKISSKIGSPRESEELLSSLERTADIYHDLVLPTEASFFTNKSIVECLCSLRILKATTFYPIILAMMQTVTVNNDKAVTAVLKKIESFVFRNFTISGNTANSAEVFFANIALDIYKEKLSSTDEICAEISKGIVSDQEFLASFQIWIGSNSTKGAIRYIFQKIHKHLDRNNELELNLNNSEVHIEHIMPENSEKWDIPKDVHDAFLWRLGNLALLGGPINISISNNSFNDKKEGYLESSIKPNKDIANYAIWDEHSIEQRQIELSNYAKDIWKK